MTHGNKTSKHPVTAGIVKSRSVGYGVRVVSRIDAPATDRSRTSDVHVAPVSDETDAARHLPASEAGAPAASTVSADPLTTETPVGTTAATSATGARPGPLRTPRLSRPPAPRIWRRLRREPGDAYNPLDYDPRIDSRERERVRIRRIAIVTVSALVLMGLAIVGARSTSPLDRLDLSDLRAATTLTTEQGRDLRAGIPIALSADQTEHIALAFQDMATLSVEQIAAVGDRTGTTAAIADAIQLVGHPMVDTGDARLPATIDDLLTASATVPAVPAPGLPSIDIPRFDDYGALAAILARGTTGLRTGTDVDRGLIAGAASIALAAAASTELGSDTPYRRLLPAEVTATIGALLDVTSDDLTAVHDAIVGTNMPGFYERDASMIALLSHDWADHPDSMRNLIGWVGGDYRTPLAGQTANALAHLIADRHDAFVRFRPDLGPTAALDPRVARSIAETLRPYLSALAGDRRTPTTDVVMFTGSEQYANFLAVLGAQPDARRVLNNALIDATESLAGDFGANPYTPVTANGTIIGRLTTAMYRGTQLAAERYDGRDEPVSFDDVAAVVESDIGQRASGRTADLFIARGLLYSRPELALEPTLAAHLRPGQRNQLSWEQVDVIGFAMQRWARAHGVPFDQFSAGIIDGRRPGLWSSTGGR